MEEKLNIKTLKITKNTLKKIKTYSSLICKKRNLECYGFLLNPKDKRDYVVYNAILACGQKVNNVSAKVGPTGLLESKAEIENLGYDVIGCWHSHHNMGAWHSGVDDSNLERLVSSIAGNREITQIKQLPEGYFISKEMNNKMLIREDGIEVEIKSSKPISFSLNHSIFNKELFYGYTKDHRLFVNIGKRTVFLDLEEHVLSFKRPGEEKLTAVGFAYSMVVSGRDVYAELATKKICVACEEDHVKKTPIEIEVIEPEEDIDFTKEELKEEIEKKVSVMGMWG